MARHVTEIILMVYMLYLKEIKNYKELKMNSEIITVAVLSYNSSKTIIETLDSIYNQSYQNIILIINDDGSQDQTKEIITSWVQKNRKRFIDVLSHSHCIRFKILKFHFHQISFRNESFIRLIFMIQLGINGKHILFQRLWRNILQFQRLDCIGEEIPRRFEYRIRITHQIDEFGIRKHLDQLFLHDLYEADSYLRIVFRLYSKEKF